MPTRRTLGGDPMDSRLVRRFGYRGSALIVLGVTWTLFGISVLIQPATEARPFVLHEMLPLPLRAGLWIAAGLVGIAIGLRGAHHDDTVGMVALMLMPLERCASFTVSWLAYVITLGADTLHPSIDVQGWSHGWYGAAIWLLIVTLVRLVAGWPNPRQVLSLPANGDADA